MTRRFALAAAALALGAPSPTAADETTFCNRFITALPHVITVQGHYCFNRNLSTASSTGAAITIAADYVVLDLNNFKLGGGSAGLGTQAYGIRATGRSNVTIRNGNIRGFLYGILIERTDAVVGGNHLVENNVLDGNTYAGMWVEGDGVLIRGNMVSATGGTTANPDMAHGIVQNYGMGVARDNIVNHTAGADGSMGIYTYTVAERNIVSDYALVAGLDYGIGSTVCRDNTVLGGDVGERLTGCLHLVGHNFDAAP
jgi:hypothetical protein